MSQWQKRYEAGESWGSLLDQQEAHIERLKTQAFEIYEERNALRTLLASLEWVTGPAVVSPRRLWGCPCCKAAWWDWEPERKQHKPGCKLAALLQPAGR